MTQLLIQAKEQQEKEEAEKAEFTAKTFNFIEHFFMTFGVKEFIVPGTENATIYEDIRFIE